MTSNKFGEKVLIATHNPGKAEEFKYLFSKYKINTIFSKDLNISEPVEDGKSFYENSLIKVKSCMPSKYVIIGDDSGLCVNALDGDPGIYSARWSKKYGGWKKSMKIIFDKMIKTKSKDFSAKFCCCLSVRWLDGSFSKYYGEINGHIVWPPIGNNGFGYDPIFVPINYTKTFGEMDKKSKIEIDHRSVAFKKMIKNNL